MFSLGAGWSTGEPPAIGKRVIIKPAYESTCIGIDDNSVLLVDQGFNRIVQDKAERFGQSVVAQEFIDGYEVGIPLLELDRIYSLPPVGFEISDHPQFLTKPKTFIEEAVLGSAKNYLLPNQFPVSPDVLKEIGYRAIMAMDMNGIARFDARIDNDGVAWIFDTNEMPPALSQSSYSLSLKSLGISYPEMLALWVASALRNAAIG